MVQEALPIYKDLGLGNQNPLFKNIVLRSYSCKRPRMGMPTLTATLKHKECLNGQWSGKEYVIFLGERYYIRDTPTSSKDNQDERYTHEIEFVSERDELLGNVYFYDAVYNNSLTKDKPCSHATTFTFYGNIREFADRLNCSLRYRGVGDSALANGTSLNSSSTVNGDGYCVVVDDYGDYDKTVTKDLSFEDKTLWEAISYGFEQFEIPFELRGKKIIFGANARTVDHEFRYGHDKELLSISMNNAKAKVINRITMIGSNENIPYYYPNETEYGHITLATPSTNAALTKTMLEISNMNQLLANTRIGEPITLIKRLGSTSASVVSVMSAFDGGAYSAYTIGTQLRHDSTGHDMNAAWNVKIHFRVTDKARYIFNALSGSTWYQNFAGTRENENGSFLQGILNETLQTSTGHDITNRTTMTEEGLMLGELMAGEYDLSFTIRLRNADQRGRAIVAFCTINNIGISSVTNSGLLGYLWQVGEKEFKIGQLGVKMNTEITDAMVGDKFSVESEPRINFQTNLMPPIYRATKGAERFYEAINNKYKKPDSTEYYHFPNPYVSGAPNEYIFKDENIKPTLEGIENASGALMGSILDVAFDDDDNDTLRDDAEEDNDKNDSLKYQHSYFYIQLHIFNGAYGFNLFQHASQTDPMTIQMTSGPCNGCKFKIQAVEFTDPTGLKSYKNPVQSEDPDGLIVEGGYDEKVSQSNFQEWQQNTQTNEIWICVQKDAETFGVLMPNQSHNYRPNVGDTFNIINIDLPQPYITNAEERLKDAGLKFMAENNEEKFTFDIKASSVFFAENPDILAAIDEYVRLKVIYNGTTYEQYVDSFDIEYKEGNVLPSVSISLTDELAVGESFVSQIVNSTAKLTSDASTAATGGRGGLTTALADERYLNKQKADRSKFRIASSDGFEVGSFVSGTRGGLFFIDPVSGNSYIEVDELKVRLKAVFEELEISRITSVRGKQILSPGGSIRISHVEDTGALYRCYFKASEDETNAECSFKSGDLVICRSFNITTGVNQDASNRYYWRRVVTVNNAASYIDILKQDSDPASTDIPRAGDIICQLGSKTDVARQSAIVLSTKDLNAPSVTLYNGIDDYSIDNKAIIEYGMDKNKTPPRPFFHCYGDMFIGPRGKSTYIRFTPENGVEIKGKLTVDSMIGDKSIDDHIKEVSPPIDEDALKALIDSTISSRLQDLQDQIDGVVEIWYKTASPSTSNAPASEWTTSEELEKHIGDMYYDVSQGRAYMWSKVQQSTDVYVHTWVEITDSATISAIKGILNTISTPWSGHRRVFTKTPTVPYEVGDLWLNDGSLLRCKQGRRETQTYYFNDWETTVVYDNTVTTIDGGIVTSGTIQVGGDDGHIKAGITGNGTADNSVRVWAGAEFALRSQAPCRIMQDGSVVMTKADITGKITANSGEIAGWKISGEALSSANNIIKLMADGSVMAGGNVRLDKSGLAMSCDGFDKLKVSNTTIGDYSEYMFNASLSDATSTKKGVANSPHFTSAGTATSGMSEMPSVMHDLGYFEGGSTISVKGVGLSFIVPSMARPTDSLRLISCTNSFIFEFLQNNVVLRSWTLGGISGPIAQGENASFSQNINETFNISTDGSCAIRFRIASGDNAPKFMASGALPLPVRSQTIDVTSTFNFSFNRGNYEKTVLGRDGLMSCWANGALFMTQKYFLAMFGQHGLRVSDAGLQKTSDGGDNWQNL